MANKMLIDATHPEETRVVVLRGNRVEEFDFESAQRKQLRGNIYLAKVTRVEPSLQAAFVDYGGNRHGFLAFSEIHPDYYQIPVADRQALIDDEQRAQRAADDEADRRSRRRRHHPGQGASRRDDVVRGEPAGPLAAEPGDVDDAGAPSFNADRGATEPGEGPHFDEPAGDTANAAEKPEETSSQESAAAADDDAEPSSAAQSDAPQPSDAAADASAQADATSPASGGEEPGEAGHANAAAERQNRDEASDDDEAAEEVVESVGGADALEEVPDRAPRYRRQYKIQEVIKRRQVMLVQVVKEERGTKGAALTTYLSLAGRYSVLMPNTARGGGISRKITSAEDRGRLKEVVQELEVPEGMGVILRTAGANRTKPEIKRDFEYLLRLWETVRDLTLKSTAPKLVYEEGSLVKRSIRDLYGKEIDEVIVAGPEGYHEAKEFMRMLMPSHARNVKLYADTQPLLSRYGVENQLDAMFSPVVQLRSGGYIVLNQAEALVAIDVNSGRATREHHIEDTALKTNLEASDEIARQLRLRDLAGLIVIDFIDMDENRNNRAVERRLKECLKQDRARIQVGRISHFGLLEMSRQRIRTSVLESSTEKCPYCGGSGHVRSVSSLALQVLRALEEQLMKGGTHNLIARTRPDVALYVLNQKRAHLRSLEERFAITITIVSDETVTPPQAFVIDRGEQVHSVEAARAIAEQIKAIATPLEDDDELEEAASGDAGGGDVESEESEPTEPIAASEPDADGPRRRRRRRGRDGGERGRGGGERGRGGQHPDRAFASAPAITPDAGAGAEPDEASEDSAAGRAVNTERNDRDETSAPRHNGERRRRRRGRRGGRRNRQEGERNGEGSPQSHPQHAHHQDVDGPQHSFAPAEEAAPPPSAEPALKQAVADLDAAPSTAASAPPIEQEAPRRRSTVREPAPVTGGGGGDSGDAPHAAPVQPASPAPAPAPEPIITELDEAETASRPRRTGWWSRRSADG
jgi:ribonuclease E